MNSKNIEAGFLQIPQPELLINLVSRRVRQLTQGARPMVVTDPKMDFADIALREIIDGKLAYEIPTSDEIAAAPAKE
jgi:DNA-directed RNA polymerase subunit omega